MQASHRLLLVPVLACLCAAGCASLNVPSFGGPPPDPGTTAWWKKNKNKAEIVPGMGYRVAGVDGYFDQEGRPINARVAKVVNESESNTLLGDAELTKAVSGFKEQIGLGPNQRESQVAFDAAEVLFQNGEYNNAAKKFNQAAKVWPDSQLEQDALFKLGESYFFAARYAKANNAYEKLLRKYPNSPHLDNVITRQFSIARYWELYHDYNHDWVTTPNLVNKTLPLFDKLGRAMKIYENIRVNDPTGPLADDAIMATANSYFRRGRYEDADHHYDLIRKDYPRSEHLKNACILGLQSKLRIYQGPDYDGTPLKEAQQLVKQQKQNFGREMDAEQRERLAVIDAQIKRELASREYMMAQHFENLEEYGSAKFYYAEVVKNHNSTPLADQARERIAALGGLPDRPESSLDWLIALAPESAERKAIKQVPLVDPANLDGTRLVEQPQSGVQQAQQRDQNDQTFQR